MTARSPDEVLIVEDDFDVRRALAGILGDQGCELATAANGEEALAHIDRAGMPGLIVLDLMMPVMDGWTFGEQFSGAGLHGDEVSIIILSGFPSPSDTDLPGRVRHVAKPIRAGALQGMVKDELARVRSELPNTTQRSDSLAR